MSTIKKVYFPVFYFSFVAFLWPLLKEHEEISLLDFAYAGLIFLVVLLIQSGTVSLFSSLLYGLRRLELNQGILRLMESAQLAYVSFIISLNVYYFCLLLVTIPQATKSYIAFALIPLFYFILSKDAWARFATFFATIFLALSLFQFGYQLLFDKTSDEEQAVEWGLEEYQALYPLAGKPERRNIYMISFDSVVSPESLRTFYGRDNADHFDYLRSSGFKVLDSAFSPGFNTRLSFHEMMELEENAPLVPAFFSTRELNPSYVLFEDLGYKVQFIFRGNYMGSNTGTLDYFFPEKRFITICDFIDQRYGFIACNSGILFHIFHKNFNTGVSMEQFIDKILERINVINQDADAPWVTIAHIWYPGHAPHDFVYTDMEAKEHFIGEMFDAYPRLNDMIQQVVSTILASDKDPVIFIYSDHGAWLTKGLDYGEENPLYSEEEIYLEKNGILFSVYPEDFCHEEFRNGYNTIDLIDDMLACEFNR